jgi:hypothetical protein
MLGRTIPMNLTRVIGKDVEVGNIEQSLLELGAFDGISGDLVVLQYGRQHRSGYSGGLKVACEVGGATPKGDGIDRDPDTGHGYIASWEEIGQTSGPIAPRGRMP